MEVDRNSPVPVWRQVAEDLRRRIDAGELRITVTGIDRLSQEYGIARATAEKVLAYLATEGVVKPVPGKGHYIVREEQR